MAVGAGVCSHHAEPPDLLAATGAAGAGDGATVRLSADARLRKGIMELTTSRLGNVPVLNIVGEIDHGNASAVGATIDELIEQKQRAILLDLSNVDYMDSGGISVLLSALRRLREGGWLGVINPNANVRRLIQIVGLALDASFKVFDSVEDAEAAARDHARL